MKVGPVNIRSLISSHDDAMEIIEGNDFDVEAISQTWLNINFPVRICKRHRVSNHSQRHSPFACLTELEKALNFMF